MELQYPRLSRAASDLACTRLDAQPRRRFLGPRCFRNRVTAPKEHAVGRAGDFGAWITVECWGACRWLLAVAKSRDQKPRDRQANYPAHCAPPPIGSLI